MQSKSVSDFHAQKLVSRRQKWRFNVPFAIKSAAIFAVLMVAAAASYFYHSGKTATVFADRADESRSRGDHLAESQWLQRYLLLRPGDTEAIVRTGVSADDAVADAPLEQQAAAINNARRALSGALATLGDGSLEDAQQLRYRLIRRLIQMGGNWLAEAERQTILLDAPQTDAAAHEFLALAKIGQLDENASEDGGASSEAEPLADKDYWSGLAQRPATDVLQKALTLDPSDLDLLDVFLRWVRRDPGKFAVRENGVSGLDPQWKSWIEQSLQRLGQADSPRAKLILLAYQFPGSSGSGASRGLDEANAPEIPSAKTLDWIVRAATNSANELNIWRDAEGVQEEGVAVSADAASAIEIDFGAQLSPPFWHYQLLARATELVGAAVSAGGDEEALDSADRVAMVQSWFDLLTTLDVPGIVPQMIEAVHDNAGRFALSRDEVERAVEVWQSGQSRLGEPSLNLTAAIAMTTARAAILGGASDSRRPGSADSVATSGDVSGNAGPWTLQRAGAAVAEYGRAIEKASSRLLQTSTTQFSKAQRSMLGRQIETARWRFIVLDSELKLAGDDSVPSMLAAIELLQSALDSVAEVPSDERVRVATRLADLYESVGLNDQAPMMLQDALKFVPGDSTLLARLAVATGRAGSSARAADQWRQMGDSQQPVYLLAVIEASLAEQASRPPERQDFSAVRSMVQALSNLSETDVDISDEVLSRLRVLKTQLPPPGQSIEQYWNSDGYRDQLVALANAPDESALTYAFVAERLAGLDSDDATAIAVKQLEQRVGDQAPLFHLVAVKIDAIKNRPIGKNLDRLIGAASVADDAATHWSETAYREAVVAGDWPRAYAALATIAPAQRTPSHLFDLVRLASLLATSEDASGLASVKGRSGADAPSGADAAIDFWTAELRSLEGEQGTQWRLLEAEELIAGLRDRGESAEAESKLAIREAIRPATRLVDEIIDRRPRWGRAIALRAEIAALDGRIDQSLELYSQALDAGDRQPRTRQRYLERLIQAGRYGDASEFIRSSARQSMASIDRYATRQIQVSLGSGDIAEAVQTAQREAESAAGDPNRWDVLARTASVAAKMSVGAEADAFAEIAQDALRRLTESPTADPLQVATIKMDLALESGDQARINEVQQLVDQSSGLENADRLLLSARADIAAGRLDAAIAKAKEANDARPTFKARRLLVGLYRATKQSDDEITVLRNLQKEFPQRADLRGELARSLAAREGEDVDWAEIESLLKGAGQASAENRLLYAALLVVRGTEKQRRDSLDQLRELVREGGDVAEDAARVQAVVLSDLLAQAEDRNSVQWKAYRTEAQALFEDLLQTATPLPVDLHRYGLLLLQFGDAGDHAKVASLLESLRRQAGSAMAALDLTVRLARAKGQGDQLPNLIEDWVSLYDGEERGQLGAGASGLLAGRVLLGVGFGDEAIGWLEQAYQQNAEALPDLVLALNQLKRFQQASEISMKHHKQHGDLQSAILLAESLLGETGSKLTEAQSSVLSDATAKFPNSSALLEGVATLMMQQGEFLRAVELFTQVRRLQPDRVRTLNNLAMAFSEIGGREAEGIEPIDQALKLTNRNPEVLDTKGVVLMKAGRFGEAEAVFREALTSAEEPRFQFHSVLALLGQKRVDDARALWGQIDQERLDPNGLTETERQQWQEMREDFESALQVIK
ncbi:tetratricopeptide repeat protein [Rubripirellula lacrimiformis]|uniref:hypothetical protein n=1 Tax=Rubripirellula lacrimiformis TaxID=1930273 RepID=UPI001C54F19F|nr:hypothetical protein [Rubripirellula lacrimiformis]